VGVERIYICKKCDKPKPKKVEGKAMKGKKLIKALQEEELDFEILPCKCLGKCKKGPNGLIMPGKKRLHRLSVKRLRRL
jgi:predicted metal-binding protein